MREGLPIQSHRGIGLHRRRWRLASVLLGIMFLGSSGVALTGCFGLADGPPIPLADVDMGRMYGGWFLIATIPNNFEKRMVAPYDVYSRRDDGDIAENFCVHSGSFAAKLEHYTVHDWVRPGTKNAHWRVQLLWPFNFPFLVLYTDPEYRYVLFGEQNRKLGWIFARTATVPDADYNALLDRFAALGYNRSLFLKFIQKPEQIGQPGFWSDGIK